MNENRDRYRPNAVIGSFLVAFAILVILLGQTLWVPVARIQDLHVRSIALSVVDALSYVSRQIGVDAFVPSVRDGFISLAGLSENPEWDTKYYNRRATPVESDSDRSGGAPTAPSSAAIAGASGQLSDEPVSVGLNDAASDAAALEQGRADGTGEISPLGVTPGPALEETAALAASVSADRRIPARNPLSAIHSSENPLKVYVFGDSQVFSLGSGLSRLVGKGAPISVDFLAIHSSGFIRDDYYDWPAKLRDTLASGDYDAVVMMLGMNDYQSFRGADGTILRKRTVEWEAAYKERCGVLIDIALASVPRVYWLGMPLVKNDAYRESLAYIESIQDSIAEEYSPDVLVRVPLASTFPGEGKPFAQNADLGDGKKIQAMSSDGSHYTVEGGMIVMLPLFEILTRDFLFADVPLAQKLQ